MISPPEEPQKDNYLSPDIEVVEIEFEQNILGSSGELPGYDPEDY